MRGGAGGEEGGDGCYGHDEDVVGGVEGPAGCGAQGAVEVFFLYEFEAAGCEFDVGGAAPDGSYDGEDCI